VLVRTTNVDPLLVDYSFDFVLYIYHYWLRYESRSPLPISFSSSHCSKCLCLLYG
jgi:hypothetical protein